MNLIRKFVKKNLLLNKKRSVVTVIGIILSVALLSALASLVSSFQKSLVSFEKQKNGDYHAGFSNVTSDELVDFDNNRAIEAYFTISELGYGVIPESKNEYKPYCRVIGTDLKGMVGARFELIEGRFPENENEVVIPRHLKNNGRVEYKVGDVISVSIGKRVEAESHMPIHYTTIYSKDAETLINLEEKSYRVVGIIERPAYGFENYECPGYTFVTCIDHPGKNVSVYARFHMESLRSFQRTVAGILGIDPDMMERASNIDNPLTAEEYDEYLKQLESTKYTYIDNSTLAQYERVWPIDNSMMVVFVLAAVVAFIIIFTSVYCIKNSFEISINEKIRQYGMLSSIGATKKQIRQSVHTEAAILGCFGIPIGLISGLFAAFVLINVSNYVLKGSGAMTIDLIYSPSIIALIVAVILGMVTIYFSAAGSARKAGKISPMEAIRNQNEIAITAKSIKTPKYVSRLFGIGGVVSYKNIKRNKKKYRTTVVSIVICTITFIVVSYFMSMANDLVSFAYSEDRFNLAFTLYMNGTDVFDRSLMDDIDGYDEMEMVQSRTFFLEDYKFTKDYAEYMKNAGIVDHQAVILALSLDDKSFERYAKECGIVNSEGKIILVNNNKVTWYDENDKQRNGDIRVYDVKDGDEINSYIFDYTNAKYDENGDFIEDSLDKDHHTMMIDKVTDVRPMGFVANEYNCFLVMSQSTAAENNIVYEENYSYFFVSKDPDKLEDDIEKNIVEKMNNDEASYSLFNRDKDSKIEKSVFLILNIFAYGLIVVIALIGITNIINTLNTSMELRSREFATLRSVGMTNRQYNKMVLLESVFTAGKSLIIGVAGGIVITVIINWVESTYDTAIPYRAPIPAVVLSIVVVMGLIYTIIRMAMDRINKRNIIETIKNENL